MVVSSLPLRLGFIVWARTRCPPSATTWPMYQYRKCGGSLLNRLKRRKVTGIAASPIELHDCRLRSPPPPGQSARPCTASTISRRSWSHARLKWEAFFHDLTSPKLVCTLREQGLSGRLNGRFDSREFDPFFVLLLFVFVFFFQKTLHFGLNMTYLMG